MPHIDLPEGYPGILGPMAFRPETAAALNELAEVLLRGPSPLSRGERELIAAYVSRLNRCTFCHRSHAAFAAHQLDGGAQLVEAVTSDPDTAPIGAKLRALLRIASKVVPAGRNVTAADVEAARAAGATDVEIHDTVLIAAAFCMFNRYVDGLDTWVPDDAEAYEAAARRTVERGYRVMPTLDDLLGA
jgi:uncharacterized peroxidase-related enzyme